MPKLGTLGNLHFTGTLHAATGLVLPSEKSIAQRQAT